METRVSAALDFEFENMFTDRAEANLNTIHLARAAIRAMREPTTEMLREAGLGATSSTEDIAYMWEAMIDAASPQEE
jgi:hypothetical protein